jgi:hypothetical protein
LLNAVGGQILTWGKNNNIGRSDTWTADAITIVQFTASDD